MIYTTIAVNQYQGSIAIRAITHYNIRNYLYNMIISLNDIGYDCKSAKYHELYSSFSEIGNSDT